MPVTLKYVYSDLGVWVSGEIVMSGFLIIFDMP